MTTFNGTKSCQDHTLEIRRELCGDDLDRGIVLTTTVKGKNNVTVLPPADDAAIALAVMEAARRDEESSWDLESAAYARQTAIRWLMTARDRAAEEADTEAREALRNKRREEVAAELYTAAYGMEPEAPAYERRNTLSRKAIDRIIDLEETR